MSDTCDGYIKTLTANFIYKNIWSVTNFENWSRTFTSKKGNYEDGNSYNAAGCETKPGGVGGYSTNVKVNIDLLLETVIGDKDNTLNNTKLTVISPRLAFQVGTYKVTVARTRQKHTTASKTAEYIYSPTQKSDTDTLLWTASAYKSQTGTDSKQTKWIVDFYETKQNITILSLNKSQSKKASIITTTTNNETEVDWGFYNTAYFFQKEGVGGLLTPAAICVAKNTYNKSNDINEDIVPAEKDKNVTIYDKDFTLKFSDIYNQYTWADAIKVRGKEYEEINGNVVLHNKNTIDFDRKEISTKVTNYRFTDIKTKIDKISFEQGSLIQFPYIILIYN